MFAIAMTLLILGITIPELSIEAIQRGELVSHLFGLFPKALSFAISFSIIGIFWAGHHIMFHYIEKGDRTLLWLNMLLLMVIAFVPFPAGLLGRYGSTQAAIAIYGATLVLAGLMFEVMLLYASSGHRLVDSKLSPGFIRKAKIAILVAPAVYAVPFCSRSFTSA